MKYTTLTLLILTFFNCASAQFDKRIIKIGLFTSLYLDQTFDSTGINFKKPNEFPRQAIAGLEFYEGAVEAVDSLNTTGIRVQLKVFDIQSESGSISKSFENGEFENLDIIFAQGNSSEIFQLSVIAKEFNLPLVNVNLPNSKGIIDNPKTFISNPTIETHLKFLNYKISNKWMNQKIIWVRRKNSLDENLETCYNNFDSLNHQSQIIKKTVFLEDIINTSKLNEEIDSTKINILVFGSLDNKSAIDFLNIITKIPKKQNIHIVGMPNWELLREIQLQKNSSIPIYYSSSFHIPIEHAWVKEFSKKFKKITYSNPSISAYKGFELIFYFTSLFSKNGRIEFNDDTDNFSKVLNDFKFKPFKINVQNDKIDYFENVNLYFLRRLNGVITKQ